MVVGSWGHGLHKPLERCEFLCRACVHSTMKHQTSTRGKRHLHRCCLVQCLTHACYVRCHTTRLANCFRPRFSVFAVGVVSSSPPVSYPILSSCADLVRIASMVVVSTRPFVQTNICRVSVVVHRFTQFRNRLLSLRHALLHHVLYRTLEVFERLNDDVSIGLYC